VKKSIFILLGIVVFGLIANSVYQQLNKKGAKAQRLECHKNITVFERVYIQEKLSLVKELFQNGHFTVKFKVEPSKYMESQLFNYVDIQDTDNYIKSSFGQKKESENLSINVLLYENDKKDPGKKNDEARQYAGYLVFDVYLDKSLVYKIQIDFMDMQGFDIKTKIDCVRQSILSI